MNNEIVPVILSGGSGTRLWPLSRKSYPKQFLKLIGNNSLFQNVALRLSNSDIVKFLPQLTITNSDYRFIVAEQLLKLDINIDTIIIEPEIKNTASAILSCCIYALQKHKNPSILVAPSDHVIPDVVSFHNIIKESISALSNGKIVTFGIKPDRPETSYGYLEIESKFSSKLVNLKKFIEKPDYEKAKDMIKSGNCFWNSGIFMFSAKQLIEEFRNYEPEMLKHVSNAVKNSNADLDFLRLNPSDWSKSKNISIDYAIMERSKNIVVAPFDGAWSDLGTWNSVWKEMNPNKKGVATSQNAYSLNCENTLLRSEEKNQIIVGFGLKDIIAVSTEDAVLVANKSESQKLNDVIKKLKKKKILQTEISSKDYRPWGWFKSLVKESEYQVKKIFVNPGAALSLQSHKFRSEHWVVVEGSARVTLDKKVKSIIKGQSVDIPIGSLHRLENLEKTPLIIIEIQIGEYLEEDDIVRYEDIYSRIHNK